MTPAGNVPVPARPGGLAPLPRAEASAARQATGL